MVIDSSAVAAIVFREPERDAFRALLAQARDPVISAATLVEVSTVVESRLGQDGLLRLDAVLRTSGVRVIALDETHVAQARVGFTRFGEGRHPAALNLGDLFAYALAKATNRSLLFKGDDFARTDVVPAYLP